MQMRRNDRVSCHEGGLQKACCTGGDADVAYVRLDRTNGQWLSALGSEDILQRSKFDCVAKRCAGSMRLHIGHILGGDARNRKRLPDGG